MEVIDLTNSDREENTPVKRRRRNSPDDEVQVVENPATPEPAAADSEADLRNTDFVITKAIGPVCLTAATNRKLL